MGAKCRTCQAPIRWAVFEGGNPVPLDPDPRPDGNLVVIGQKGGTPVVVVDSLMTPPDAPPERYVTHFVTCPNAEEHRKRGK